MGAQLHRPREPGQRLLRGGGNPGQQRPQAAVPAGGLPGGQGVVARGALRREVPRGSVSEISQKQP